MENILKTGFGNTQLYKYDSTNQKQKTNEINLMNHDEFKDLEAKFFGIFKNIKNRVKDLSAHTLKDTEISVNINSNPLFQRHIENGIGSLETKLKNAEQSFMKLRNERIKKIEKITKRNKLFFQVNNVSEIDGDINPVKKPEELSQLPSNGEFAEILEDKGTEDDFQKEANNFKQELMIKAISKKKDIEAATDKIMDISRLMNTFSVKVGEQDMMAGEINKMAGESVTSMQKANKELVLANEYNASSGTYWSYFFIAMGVFLLVYDLWKYK